MIVYHHVSDTHGLTVLVFASVILHKPDLTALAVKIPYGQILPRQSFKYHGMDLPLHAAVMLTAVTAVDVLKSVYDLLSVLNRQYLQSVIDDFIVVDGPVNMKDGIFALQSFKDIILVTESEHSVRVIFVNGIFDILCKNILCPGPGLQRFLIPL